MEFSTALAAHKLAVENVELFGDSLILDVAGKRNDLSCANFLQIHPAAQMSGIHQIALSFAGSSQVEICKVEQAQVKPTNPPPHLYASIDNIVSVGDDEANLGQENAPANSSPEPASPPLSNNPAAVRKRIIKASKAQNLAITALKITSTRIDIAFINDTYRSE